MTAIAIGVPVFMGTVIAFSDRALSSKFSPGAKNALGAAGLTEEQAIVAVGTGEIFGRGYRGRVRQYDTRRFIARIQREARSAEQ
jgi:hypothetical protein